MQIRGESEGGVMQVQSQACSRRLKFLMTSILLQLLSSRSYPLFSYNALEPIDFTSAPRISSSIENHFLFFYSFLL